MHILMEAPVAISVRIGVSAHSQQVARFLKQYHKIGTSLSVLVRCMDDESTQKTGSPTRGLAVAGRDVYDAT